MKHDKWRGGRLAGLLLGSLATVAMLASHSVSASTNATSSEPELLEASSAFQVSARMVNDRKVELRYTIADGYYMYRDRFHFSINGTPIVLDKKSWPAGKVKQDATFGKVVTYRKSVRMLIPVAALGKDLSIKAVSQGCADAGVCYPPLAQTLVMHLGTSEWTAPQGEVASGFSHERPAGTLAERLTQGK
ncbi:MAG: protein-disulfide reductase DsbD N-terminal domain-containing protein [Betaproteobacteria bacterium]